MNRKDLNNPFDQFIRSGLQEQDHVYDPESWAILKNKFDLARNEALSDASLRNGLHSYSESADPMLWNKINHSLLGVKERQRSIVFRKSAELLFILLASWWYLNLAYYPNNQRETIVADLMDQHFIDNTSYKNSPNATSELEEIHAAPEIISAKKPVSGSSGVVQIEQSARSESHSKDKQQNTTLNVGSNRLITERSYSAPEFQNAKVPVITDSPSETAGDSAGQNLASQEGQTNESTLSEMEHIASIGLKPINFDTEIFPLTNAISKAAHKQWFWLSVAVGIDKDLVKSPYPNQLSPENLGRLADNYSLRIGLLFNYRFFDIQTGMNLGFKNYESVYTGSNQVRVISVPLIARVKLKQVGAFRGYVLGGFVANYVGYANYSEFDLFKEMPHLQLKENNRKIRNNALLASGAYDSGIMEGETLKGNHYYTLNMGIGFEYAIHRRYKLFLEQTYDHQINSGGIGPGFDRFYTSTTALGIRALMYR